MTAHDSQAIGILAAAVHVLHPVERVPLILTAGTPVTDPAIAEQITNPDCWEGGEPPSRPSTAKATRKSAKSADS
ncbi:hypothetical protein [Streptomyces abikoensis]|uniref:Uncharacterized protein n=1 Tax=Streptomyces abikoensis TaxID=97398 RepID=A0ABW7T8X9_9ACTN